VSFIEDFLTKTKLSESTHWETVFLTLTNEEKTKLEGLRPQVLIAGQKGGRGTLVSIEKKLARRANSNSSLK